jgi:hypothetical protein
MIGDRRQRVLYAAEALLIAVGLLPLFMMFYPVALLAAPATVLAGYAAVRPAWMFEGRRERWQYVHLAAGVAIVAILAFVLSLARVI